VGAALNGAALISRGEAPSVGDTGTLLSMAGKSEDVLKFLNASNAAKVLGAARIVGTKIAAVKALGPAGDAASAIYSGIKAIQAYKEGNTGGMIGNGMQSVGGTIASIAATTALLAAAGVIGTVGAPALAVAAVGGTVLMAGGVLVDWIWGKKK